MNKNKTTATMLGLAIGDALGQPFEFQSAQKISESSWKGNYIYGNVWKLEAGQWTDDTKMALCIADSLLENKKFDVDDIAKRYIKWVESGDLRGIGNRCAAAINRMERGLPFIKCGEVEKPESTIDPDSLHHIGDFVGCGTVMRCAPIGIYYKDNWVERKRASVQDAMMTHNHQDAIDGNLFLNDYISLLSDDESDKFIDFDVVFNQEYKSSHITTLLKQANHLAKNTDNFYDGLILGDDGTAHETLASAVYCFLYGNSFEEAVVSSVLLGGDTDSRAAIAGALAGTYYGLENIPNSFLDGLEDKDRLIKLDSELYNSEFNNLIKEDLK